jgi:diguanylate cyclase (GGDEF)-like protein
MAIEVAEPTEGSASFLHRVPPELLGWGSVLTALVALIAWSMVKPLLTNGTVTFMGDMFFGALVVTAAFGSAWHSRNVRSADQRKHYELLEELSRRDELSGLHNYRFMRESMRMEMGNAVENQTSLAVIMLDLNDFKDVNDRFGHQAGDALIIAIGQAIRDEVQSRGTVARYGGDEFAVLLPDTDRAGATDLAAEIADAIRRASVAATRVNRHLSVTASYGIAVFPDDGRDPEVLIAAADRALYDAKAQVVDVISRTDERHAQDVFFAIGEAIGSSPEPTKLLANLAKGVTESLNIDTCSIWLVQDDGVIIRPRAYFSRQREFVREFGAVQAHQPMSLAEVRESGLLTDRTVYVDDASTSGALPQRLSRVLPPDMWLITVPFQEPRIGFVMLSARHAESTPPHLSLAEAIAKLASSALLNADSFVQTARQAEQLRTVAGIGGLLLGDESYEERVGRVVRRVVEVTDCDMLTLDTDDPSGEAPFVRSFYGRAPDGSEYDETRKAMWLSLRPALTDPPVREFLEKASEPIIMDDPLNQVPDFYRQVIVDSGTQTVVVMPITWHGELNALFYFASYRKNAFNAHDIALMHAIASQVGPALEVARLNVELERSYAELKDSHKDAIQRLAYAAEARDPYTGRYLQRIAALSEAIARRVGLDDDAVEAIGYAAVVHDIGKLKIPDEVLTKPGELTEEDWAIMRQHPEFGAELLGKGQLYDVARTVALHHHERWDGSGYPFGLKGEDIPLESRIVAVADVYDALISARPYKHAWPRERALAELLQMRAKKLCPRSIDAFLQLWSEGEIGRIEEATADSNFTTDFRDRRAA